MDKRYRLAHLGTHEDIRIADDEKRVYLHGYQVDLLNEYDEKVKVMEAKLNELGYECAFLCQDYSMSEKKFTSGLTKKPSTNQAGEWKVVSREEYEEFEIKKEEPEEE